MRWRIFLVVALVPGLTAPATAGIIFGRKNKPNPKERVPELIAIVKTDGDKGKRKDAAEELRKYDPAAFPEIVPVLIDVLLADKEPGVRAEAAQSLGKLRPVSQAAGLALEEALAKDASMLVRLQARTALLHYRWAGYRSVKKDEPIAKTQEPPLADPPPKSSALPVIRRTRNITQRIEPQPVSPASLAPPVVTTSPGGRPLPVGPTVAPIKTTEPPLAPAPPGEKGPELTPQE
jgi:hypothetical protein